MKKIAYCVLLGFFVISGMACAFIAQIPNYYLADSFEAMGWCSLGGIALLIGAAPAFFVDFP